VATDRKNWFLFGFIVWQIFKATVWQVEHVKHRNGCGVQILKPKATTAVF
jgi:hypothetical protein